jgi:hypothetical protein
MPKYKNDAFMLGILLQKSPESWPVLWYVILNACVLLSSQGMGQIQKAMDVYEKAMEIAPDNDEAKQGKEWLIDGRYR